MTQRPKGLDALLNYVAENLDVTCEHRGGSYFDRTICPAPCNAMHDCCKDCGEPLDDCTVQDEHHPMLARWSNRHTVPAEVCGTCSDPAAGKWVPVPFCEKAHAKLQADPYCALTYGVIQPEGDGS